MPVTEALLKGATAPVTSSPLRLPSHPPTFNKHTVSVVITAGAPTAATVRLNGRPSSLAPFIDLGTYALTAADLTAKNAQFSVADRPMQEVNVQLETLTGGGTVDIYYFGS